MTMRNILKLSVCLFLLAGCRGTQGPKIPTVSEELDYMTYMMNELSLDAASALGVSEYDMSGRFYELIGGHVWEKLKSMEDIPQPDNLKRYFAGLEDMIAVADWHYDSYSKTAGNDRKQILKRFYNTVDQLQKYADGRLAHYPALDLIQEVNSLLATEWMMYSEGICDVFWAMFAYRLLQQAVRYCPDISLLCAYVSEDGKVGIYDNTLRLDTYQPCFNPVFLCDEDGQWRVYIEDMFLPNSAYSLQCDEATYYVLSKQGDSIRSRGYDGFDVRLICDSNGYFEEVVVRNEDYLGELEDWLFGYDNTSVLFDPIQLQWKACFSENGGYYHRIPGSPILQLQLGDYIQFELI